MQEYEAIRQKHNLRLRPLQDHSGLRTLSKTRTPCSALEPFPPPPTAITNAQLRGDHLHLETMADSTAAAPKPSSSVKLVLLGEAAVGKVKTMPSKTDGWEANIGRAQSSLVLRFVNNDFQENKEPTIGGRLQQTNALPGLTVD